MKLPLEIHILKELLPFNSKIKSLPNIKIFSFFQNPFLFFHVLIRYYLYNNQILQNLTENHFKHKPNTHNSQAITYFLLPTCYYFSFLSLSSKLNIPKLQQINITTNTRTSTYRFGSFNTTRNFSGSNRFRLNRPESKLNRAVFPAGFSTKAYLGPQITTQFTKPKLPISQFSSSNLHLRAPNQRNLHFRKKTRIFTQPNTQLSTKTETQNLLFLNFSTKI